ncbi:MAG: thioesterase [Calditrichaeota bacterium]|nr:MAG: thioesterase [Calditrichota bacterium]MBL1204448.1 thioesterase [Calditrichota bacterium]NOG44277.1 thioesterase [Calditrichota bacterium]
MKYQNSNPWIVKLKPNPNAKLKLFCLPFAGGSSVAYRDWNDVLPATVELCAIEIPGRGQRLGEPLLKNLPELVTKLAEGIKEELDRPFVLFGHSMGAATGFELTHLLQSKYQKTPEHLFFSGRGAPQIPERDEPIHKLPKNEFIDKIRSFNGTPKEVLAHEELMELVIPIIRADFEVCETYNYQQRAPLNIPMTVLGGLSDEDINKSDLESWGIHTQNEFNIRMFPGGHFYLQDQVHALVQTILRDLNNHFNLNS